MVPAQRSCGWLLSYLALADGGNNCRTRASLGCTLVLRASSCWALPYETAAS